MARGGRIAQIDIDFYFFVETKSAKNQPINVQPKSHDPTRTRILSYFAESFTAAKYAGVKNRHTTIPITTAYLTINKTFTPCHIFYIPYFAAVPNSSSIRINWLYFAIRSVRYIEPVLIWPAFVETARSAIVVSSFSPLRWEMITP